MLLKATTTFLLLFGVILTFGFFWLLDARPHTHDKVALGHYSVVLGGYLLLTVFCYVGAAVCSIFIVRQVKQTYLAQTRANLDELVESSLQTHRKTTGNNE